MQTENPDEIRVKVHFPKLRDFDLEEHKLVLLNATEQIEELYSLLYLADRHRKLETRE